MMSHKEEWIDTRSLNYKLHYQSREVCRRKRTLLHTPPSMKLLSLFPLGALKAPWHPRPTGMLFDFAPPPPLRIKQLPKHGPSSTSSLPLVLLCAPTLMALICPMTSASCIWMSGRCVGAQLAVLHVIVSFGPVLLGRLSR